jgi:YD repeat-containing protein
VLLRNETEYKRWELFYEDGILAQEYLYVEGLLSEKREYLSGKLTEEIYYEDEIVAERRTYVYSGDELQEVRGVDGDDVHLYRDVYERTASGRLRRIHRVTDEAAQQSAFTYARDELVQEWHENDEEGILFRYHDGEQLAEEVWEGLKLMLAEEVRMHEGRKEVVMEDNTLGIVTTQYYDEEDRVSIERTLAEDELVEHIRFEYSEEQVSQRTRVTRAAKEDWRFEYDAEGQLIRETLYRNTRIVKVIEHTGENSYYEEIYRNEVPALRVYFEDGKKTDELFIGTPADTE